MVALYVHIPFCAHKCPYCDFNTYAAPSFPENDYCDALIAELQSYARGSFAGRRIRTVYFGGGTPSLFGPDSLARVIEAADRELGIEPGAEISLEANPEALPPEKLEGLRRGGFNRLSLGAQSFDPEALTRLGRRHSAADIRAAVSNARAAGIDNVSIDLIYGQPGQSLAALERDIELASACEPSHVSAYSLTIERGTPFYNSVHKGVMKMPEDELVAEMMTLLCRELPARGYTRYEISNFARPGRQSIHNLAYWQGHDYLGLGAGAHSFCRGLAKRWSNLALPGEYMKAVGEHGSALSWHEDLSPSELLFERFFVGLRMIEGVELGDLRERFGMSFDAAFPGLLERLEAEGLGGEVGERLKLSARGLMLHDSVMEMFLEHRAAT